MSQWEGEANKEKNKEDNKEDKPEKRNIRQITISR